MMNAIVSYLMDNSVCKKNSCTILAQTKANTHERTNSNN
jgi:hypothetical protein